LVDGGKHLRGDLSGLQALPKLLDGPLDGGLLEHGVPGVGYDGDASGAALGSGVAREKMGAGDCSGDGGGLLDEIAAVLAPAGAPVIGFHEGNSTPG